MPLKLPTRCRHPGCPTLVRGARFCDAHCGDDTRYSDARRGTPAERGYDATWAKLAQLRRDQDAYLCQPCLKRNTLSASQIVDHIIPVHIRPDFRLELGNTQVLCSPCHQRKTQDDSRRFGSSMARILTADQRRQREAALRIAEPPRAAEDESRVV